MTVLQARVKLRSQNRLLVIQFFRHLVEPHIIARHAPVEVGQDVA